MKSRKMVMLALLAVMAAASGSVSKAQEWLTCGGPVPTCLQDGWCFGDFTIQEGCHITCYQTVFPPNEPPYWVVTGEDDCSPIEGR